MPPKRKASRGSHRMEEGSPSTPKRLRERQLRPTPKGGDSEPISLTSPPSTISGMLPQAQSSSQLPSTSQLPLSPPDGYRSVHLVCSTDTTAILADAIDLEDYKSLLHYFWGHIFVVVRNLKTKERKEIFEATIPDFVQGGEMRAKLETEFDMCYRLFQRHFVKGIEEYGQRWLNSPASQRFRESELQARKQKRPHKYPIPVPPETGQDLLQFEEHQGLQWDYKCAIDFWSLCLPAFTTRSAPAKHVGWFSTEDDLAYKELSGVALELIRQFAVYEMRSPGGYSLEAHTHALRIVMPTILSNNQMELYELPSKLGLHATTLSEIPSMPNYNLAPWAPEDSTRQPGDGFDETKTDLDVSTSHLSYGALERQDHVLFNERLKDVDKNIQHVDEGLQPADEPSPRELESATQYVKEVEDDINTMFTETLRASLDDDGYLVSDYHPSVEDLGIPQLHAPFILDGPRMTKRAEMYASGNIWARQVMAQADRAIEIRRLNALFVAAQHAISLLEMEERKFQEQITQLEEANKFLSEAWQQVQDRIQQNKAVKEKRDRLSGELDTLRQSQVAQENGGTGGSFLGFQGLRFRDRVGGTSTSVGLACKPAMGSGDQANPRFPFPGTRSSTPGPSAMGPISTTPLLQSNYARGISSQYPQNAQPPVSESFKVTQGLGLREQQPIPARPVFLGPSAHSSFLSRMGHHGRVNSGTGNRALDSFPSFASFDGDPATRVGGQGTATGVASGPASPYDTSQPETPCPPPIAESHHAGAYNSAPGTGEGEQPSNGPPRLRDSPDLARRTSNTLAHEQESELDDAVLLQATVSAEQQLEQSHGRST